MGWQGLLRSDWVTFSQCGASAGLISPFGQTVASTDSPKGRPHFSTCIANKHLER